MKSKGYSPFGKLSASEQYLLRKGRTADPLRLAAHSVVDGWHAGCAPSELAKRIVALELALGHQSVAPAEAG